jgi:hypothetical protein
MHALQARRAGAVAVRRCDVGRTAKAAGLRPAGHAGNCIAALRDQGRELYATAQEAQGNAGEEEQELDPHSGLPPIDT